MARRGEQGQVGVRTARVVANVDPEEAGRVEVELAPAGSRGTGVKAWARLATLSAGDGRGTWFLPGVGDEVLVAFEAGDTSRPIVIGSLWSAGDAPPETGPARTERTTIRTRSGAVIRIDEPATTPPTITVETGAGDSIRVGPAGVTITSTGNVTVTAAAKVELTAAVTETNAAVAQFAGIVKCDTLIATNVVASSYTPGAGNVR